MNDLHHLFSSNCFLKFHFLLSILLFLCGISLLILSVPVVNHCTAYKASRFTYFYLLSFAGVIARTCLKTIGWCCIIDVKILLNHFELAIKHVAGHTIIYDVSELSVAIFGALRFPFLILCISSTCSKAEHLFNEEGD